MEREERTFIEENGFTLVEVLVAALILSFLIIAICAFMTTGSNLYKKSSREVDLQQEAQVAMNQLNDMILSANRFTVVYRNKGLQDEVAIMYSQTTEEINTKVNYCIIWIKEREKLYFLKKDADFTFTGTESEMMDLCSVVTDEENLMAQHIESMQIDTSELVNNQAVSITTDFVIQDNTYEVTKQIKLRNKQE
ncbi:PilW family protein [Anaerosporobacter sp.]|uniref:PilW family protein n=1 Tax=Anaerosporobacter sp. TaxID=1872529 RepID=UPI00286FA31A|nr:prepilin-type N-terminal cleavage/methylation domain-containing protein [Anaerosporobacter sp.]